MYWHFQCPKIYIFHGFYLCWSFTLLYFLEKHISEDSTGCHAMKSESQRSQGFFAPSSQGGPGMVPIYSNLLQRGSGGFGPSSSLSDAFLFSVRERERAINLICSKSCLYGRSLVLSGRSGFDCALWQGVQGATTTIKAAKKRTSFSSV